MCSYLDTSEAVPVKFNDEKATYKTDYDYIVHTFISVTIWLLDIGTICYHCINIAPLKKTPYHSVISNL